MAKRRCSAKKVCRRVNKKGRFVKSGGHVRCHRACRRVHAR